MALNIIPLMTRILLLVMLPKLLLTGVIMGFVQMVFNVIIKIRPINQKEVKNLNHLHIKINIIVIMMIFIMIPALEKQR